jgi:hypothetical protein
MTNFGRSNNCKTTYYVVHVKILLKILGREYKKYPDREASEIQPVGDDEKSVCPVIFCKVPLDVTLCTGL